MRHDRATGGDPLYTVGKGVMTMNAHEPYRLTTDEERAELLSLAHRAIRAASLVST